jgi:hypothetical protein
LKAYRLALAARYLAVGPALGLVGTDRVGDQLELGLLFGALRAAAEPVGTKDQQRVHGVGFGQQRGSGARHSMPVNE